MIYFISGHRDLTQDQFDSLYVPEISKVENEDPEAKFVVGDYYGADEMAQTWLSRCLEDKSRVTVYHMFDHPRIYVDPGFNSKGGFKTDVERDSAMTDISDLDIAFIGKGRWTSGTAQNILRRHEFEQK